MCICSLVAIAKPCLLMYSEIPSASPLIHVYILQGWSGLLRRHQGPAGFDLWVLVKHTQLRAKCSPGAVLRGAAWAYAMTEIST